MIGTTPTHTFRIPSDIFPTISEVKVTYKQNGKVVLEKYTDDCTIQNGAIVTKLSQSDTFLFDANSLVEMQVRILTLGDDCVKSKVIYKSTTECLDIEVLA